MIDIEKALDILTDHYEYDEESELNEAIDLVVKVVRERVDNCMLKMFGECSYKETGCSDCKIKHKIFEALKNYDSCSFDGDCSYCSHNYDCKFRED